MKLQDNFIEREEINSRSELKYWHHWKPFESGSIISDWIKHEKKLRKISLRKHKKVLIIWSVTFKVIKRPESKNYNILLMIYKILNKNVRIRMNINNKVKNGWRVLK